MSIEISLWKFWNVAKGQITVGEGLSEQQQSVATALAGDTQRTLWLHQYSTLYLSSA